MSDSPSIIDSTDSADLIAAHARDASPLPAGIYYAKSQIDTGRGVGGAVIGVCAPDCSRADNAWKDEPVTVIVDDRPDKSKPLFRIRRGKFRMQDVGISGARMWKNTTPRGTGTLIEVTQQGADWPVGSISFERVTLMNAERGWYLAPGNHCDHITITDCSTDRVDYPYWSNENQAVENIIRNLVCRGSGKTVLTIADGGRLTAEVTPLDNWDALIALGDKVQNTGPTKNNGFYEIFLWMDGTTYIKRSVEERRKHEDGAAVVKIRGYAADKTDLGDPLILNARSRISVNVERMNRPAFVWPAEGAK